MANDELRLMRIEEVARRIGLARPTIWKMVREGSFPAGIKLTKRATRWKSEEVERWVEARPRARAAA